MTDKPAVTARKLTADPIAQACAILGVKRDDVLASATNSNGTLTVIVNQGQKFRFTPDELAHPTQARTRLRREGLRVLKPLDPTRLANPPKEDDGLPEDD
jgi:hypothetical protein